MLGTLFSHKVLTAPGPNSSTTKPKPKEYCAPFPGIRCSGLWGLLRKTPWFSEEAQAKIKQVNDQACCETSRIGVGPLSVRINSVLMDGQVCRGTPVRMSFPAAVLQNGAPVSESWWVCEGLSQGSFLHPFGCHVVIRPKCLQIPSCKNYLTFLGCLPKEF